MKDSQGVAMKPIARRLFQSSIAALVLSAICLAQSEPKSANKPPAAQPTTAPLVTPAPVNLADPNNLRITNDVRVYQMVKDAVVNITSTRIVTARVGTGDEVFDRFFGGQIRQVPAQSLGSGFVIHS